MKTRFVVGYDKSGVTILTDCHTFDYFISNESICTALK